MAIPDTSLETWFVAPANNKPADTAFIRRDLPGQWRNIKSVSRGASLEKEWVRTGKQPALAADQGGGLANVAFVSGDGDLTSTFTPLRKMRLRPTTGGTVMYGAVATSVFAFGVTVVTMLEYVGLPIAGVAYQVDVGVSCPNAAGMPLYAESGGPVTITDPATTAVANFLRPQPDTDYFFRVNLVSWTTAVGGALISSSVVKSSASALFGINQAPGGGTSCTWEWTLLREL